MLYEGQKDQQGRHNSRNKIFEGLTPVKEGVFPKKCSKCGTVYENFMDFIDRTQELSNTSGLQYFGEGQNLTVLFRNCFCQSTLVISCKNRRDESERGVERRETFDKILKLLVQVHPDEKSCREELLKLMR